MDDPFAAFCGAFMLHALLDYADYEYMPTSRDVDLYVIDASLAIDVLARMLAEPDREKRTVLLWAAFGAILPDLIEGINLLSGGDTIFPWHVGDPTRPVEDEAVVHRSIGNGVCVDVLRAMED